MLNELLHPQMSKGGGVGDHQPVSGRQPGAAGRAAGGRLPGALLRAAGLARRARRRRRAGRARAPPAGTYCGVEHRRPKQIVAKQTMYLSIFRSRLQQNSVKWSLCV